MIKNIFDHLNVYREFVVPSSPSFYTHPESGERVRGIFLSESSYGFYHGDYVAGDMEARNTLGTVANVVTTLKNQFNDKSTFQLRVAMESMKKMIQVDFSLMLRFSKWHKIQDWIVCVAPRAKAEARYTPYQQLFRAAVKEAIQGNPRLTDGTNYITRHTDTITTHMHRSGYGGEGKLPYPGITKDTCHISLEVKGKNIILVDDLYTAGVNIDEDLIQTLRNKGAARVVLYVLGKTVKKQKNNLV